MNLWIEAKVKEDGRNSEEFIICEICKDQIHYSSTAKFRCKKKNEVKESIEKRNTMFILTIVFFFIFATLLGVIVYFANSDFIEEQAASDSPQEVIFTLIIVIDVLMFALFLYVLLGYFLVKVTYECKVKLQND